MNDWLACLEQARSVGPAVLVGVVAVRGSAPREPGACMLVSADRVEHSIGGGSLEFGAIAAARQLLRATAAEVRRYRLGADAGQCCGGTVWLSFEPVDTDLLDAHQQVQRRLDREQTCVLISHAEGGRIERRLAAPAELSDEAGADLLVEVEGGLPRGDRLTGFRLLRTFCRGDFEVIVFGAGHVGRAVVGVLAPLVDRLLWCDARDGQFPPDLPLRVRARTDDPFDLIESRRSGACYLVLTHNHSLDLLLCEAILRRADFAYCGLIGSQTKRRRFEQVLADAGIPAETLARLRCPIGIAGIDDKRPAAIAVAVGAELLRLRDSRTGSTGPGRDAQAGVSNDSSRSKKVR